MSRERAKTLLRHYIGYAFELGGERLDAASYAELEEIVDCIVDVVKEEIKKESTSSAKVPIPVQVQGPPLQLQSEEMHSRLDAFFGEGINLRAFLRESFIAADAVSASRLYHLIDSAGFNKERYDEVLEKAGEEGWSLCVIGDDAGV
jgi:hypothetical protein